MLPALLLLLQQANCFCQRFLVLLQQGRVAQQVKLKSCQHTCSLAAALPSTAAGAACVLRPRARLLLYLQELYFMQKLLPSFQ
jgi:hypothetical protein